MSAETGSHELPKTLVALFSEVKTLGGQVEEIERSATNGNFDVLVPRALVDGTTELVRVATVGYHRRDGKWRIGRGVHTVRDRIARRRAWLQRTQG